MSCWPAAQRGSGVGQPDLNQYLPSPCLLVRATREVQTIESRDGLEVVEGGGELGGRLEDHGLLGWGGGCED